MIVKNATKLNRTIFTKVLENNFKKKDKLTI